MHRTENEENSIVQQAVQQAKRKASFLS